MALIYDFIFVADDYSGQEAVVLDSTGTPVEGSPFTLDAAGRISLPLDEGIYYATTSNSNLAMGNATTTGVLNLPASIATGGGVVLDGTVYAVAYNAGTDEIPDGGLGLDITFDELGAGVVAATGAAFTLPEGIYEVKYDIEPSQPAEARYGFLEFQIDAGANNPIGNGPRYIAAQPTAIFASYALSDHATIAGGDITVHIALESVAGGGSPLTLDYASLEFTKIG